MEQATRLHWRPARIAPGYGLANTRLAGGVVTHGHDGRHRRLSPLSLYARDNNWGYVGGVLLNSGGRWRAPRNINRLAGRFCRKSITSRTNQSLRHPAELTNFARLYAQRAAAFAMLAFLDDWPEVSHSRSAARQSALTCSAAGSCCCPPGEESLSRKEKEPEGNTILFSGEGGRMA